MINGHWCKWKFIGEELGAIVWISQIQTQSLITENDETVQSGIWTNLKGVLPLASPDESTDVSTARSTELFGISKSTVFRRSPYPKLTTIRLLFHLSPYSLIWVHPPLQFLNLPFLFRALFDIFCSRVHFNLSFSFFILFLLYGLFPFNLSLTSFSKQMQCPPLAYMRVLKLDHVLTYSFYTRIVAYYVDRDSEISLFSFKKHLKTIPFLDQQPRTTQMP